MRTLMILIPCYNEEVGLAYVLRQVPRVQDQLKKEGFALKVIVIDNNSTDNTAKIARYFNTKVLQENRQGKGHAVMKGIRYALSKSSVIAMIDGDGTYDIKELPRLVFPLNFRQWEISIGSRFDGIIEPTAMTLLNKTGNQIIRSMSQVMYNREVTDVCTGFVAWKSKILRQSYRHLVPDEFNFEVDMITKLSKLGYKFVSIPISYSNRIGKSHLNPIRDGLKITAELIYNYNWMPQYDYEKIQVTMPDAQPRFD